MLNFTRELTWKHTKLLKNLRLQVCVMLDLSLPDILVKLEVRNSILPILSSLVLIAERWQFCSGFDHPKYLLLSLLHLSELQLVWLVILNLVRSSFDFIDSLLELRLCQVCISFNDTFDSSQLHLFNFLKVIRKCILYVESGSSLELIGSRTISLRVLGIFQTLISSKSFHGLHQILLVFSVIHFIDICFDLNIDIHIQTIIVLLKLGGVSYSSLLTLELGYKLETVFVL